VRTATVTTVTECQLLSLAVMDFRRLLEANPSLKAAITEIAEQRTAQARAHEGGPRTSGASDGTV
jgi:CRP-like cAMP-binding protein